MLYRLDWVHRHRQQVFLPWLQVCLLLLLLSPRLQAVVSKMLVLLHKFHHQNLSPPPRSLALIRSFPTTLPPFSLVPRKPSALAPVVPQSQQNRSPKSFPTNILNYPSFSPRVWMNLSRTLLASLLRAPLSSLYPNLLVPRSRTWTFCRG